MIDEKRAGMLCAFTVALPGDIQLMPLREDKREPAIRKCCKLDSEEAQALLVTPTRPLDGSRGRAFGDSTSARIWPSTALAA